MSYKEVNSAEALEADAGTGIPVHRRALRAGVPHRAPLGALNIPIMHREPFGMVPNPDFLGVVEGNFERGDKLLLGCQSGARSARAAEILSAAGFSDVSNVRGGFGGAHTDSGEVIERGWLESGLPVDRGEQEGRNYSDLQGGRG